MKVMLSALLTGTVFGAGLAWSGMTNPERVIGFLDIAGRWDPTLLLVMAGALAVAVPLFPLVLKRPRPWFTAQFALPSRTDIDRRLIGGAAIFGTGWGLAGLCPGPAIAGLVTGSPKVIAFLVCMLAGQWLAGLLESHSVPSAGRET